MATTPGAAPDRLLRGRRRRAGLHPRHRRLVRADLAGRTRSRGLTGLAGLGAALLGTRLAWQLPISWTAVQAILGGADESTWHQVLFWLVQPADSRAAAITAGLLFVSGVIAYALRAGPMTPAAEVTMDQ